MIYAPRSFAMGRFCFALIKPLRHGFGIPQGFISSPEAPLRGELSAKQTERLYEGKPVKGTHFYLQ